MPPLPPELQGHLVKLHDTLAKRTMPHFEPFSEGWASVADGFARRQARTPHRTPPNPQPALPCCSACCAVPVVAPAPAEPALSQAEHPDVAADLKGHRGKYTFCEVPHSPLSCPCPCWPL